MGECNYKGGRSPKHVASLSRWESAVNYNLARRAEAEAIGTTMLPKT